MYASDPPVVGAPRIGRRLAVRQLTVPSNVEGHLGLLTSPSGKEVSVGPKK